MATRWANQGRKIFDVSLALLVLASTSATLVLLGSVTYCRGRAVDTEERFFSSKYRPTIDEATAACPVEYALRTQDANDVVFLGDSTCRTGLDPARFERATGLVAYNLGSLRGIGPAGFVITAKAYLLHHAKPRAIVLCVSPVCFEDDATRIGGPLQKQFVENYGAEVSELVPLFDRISYFCKRGVRTVWKPTEARERELVDTDVRDTPLRGFKSESYHTLQRKTLEKRGFFDLPGAHGPPRGIGKAEPTLIRDEWTQGIRRLARICAEAGVPLVVQFAPISAELARARDLAPLETWSRELELSHPNTQVARPIVLIYHPTLLWDSIHLNSAGVDKFVELVARNVRAALSR